jgi:methylenetetrahydrofolate--tRNA-(uracil-5-)-methyltransferase
VVTAESVNWDVAFRQSRYDKGGDDAYGNCPFNQEEYEAFVAALLAAEKVEPKTFEKIRYFEGCLPIEVMAERGYRTLSFGCMKPVGLTDPRTGRRPHAVVQLRAENDPPTAYNLVGFQTRMKWPDQKRVFRMIPGLENAEFERSAACTATPS